MRITIPLLLLNIFVFANINSVDIYTSQCIEGNVESCNKLGNIYEHGLNGLAENYDKAFAYYNKSCDGKFYKACSNLGYFYQLGYGTKKNDHKAYELYKEACDHQVAKGCYNLGTFFNDGTVVEKNYKEAKKLFEFACQNKLYNACVRLGILYEDGSGVEKNNKTAMMYYKKACDNDNSIGCHNLALQNYYLKKDKAKVISLFNKACKLGYQDACENYSILTEEK